MELYTTNKGLLFKLARRYIHVDPAVDTDDLVQAGYTGLVEAERTYDASKGKGWVSWATWYVKNAMQAAVGIRGTKERAHLHAVSLDAPIGDDEDGGTLLDTLADESLPEASSGLVESERTTAVQEAVNRLESERRETIQRYYFQRQSLAQTGEGMGLTLVETRKLRKKALNDLRRDKDIRALWLEEGTRYYAHKGVRAFNTDWTSVTEAAAIWRIEQGRVKSLQA